MNKTLQRIKRLGPLFTEYMSEFISEKRSTFFIHTIYSLKTFIISIKYLCICFSLHLVFLLDQGKFVSSLNILNHIDRNWSLKIDYATTGALPASSCFLIATHPGVMSRARKWTHFVHDLHKAWSMKSVR